MIDLMTFNIFSFHESLHDAVSILIGLLVFLKPRAEQFSSTSTHLTDVQYIFLSLDPSNHRPGQPTKEWNCIRRP